MRLNSYKNVLCLFLFIGLVKLSQAQDFSEVFQKVNNYYKTTNYYARQCEGGIRWDDQAIGIEWPADEVIRVNEKDQSLPFLEDIL